MELLWPSYQPFLSNPDPDVVVWALRRLETANPAEALVAARRLLSSSSDETASTCASLLESFATIEDEPLLREHLAKQREDEHHAFLFVSALARLKGPQIFQEMFDAKIKSLWSARAFWVHWGDADAAACSRALYSLIEKKQCDTIWELTQYSDPSSAARILSLTRVVEDKNILMSALLFECGADDLFADAPSDAQEEVKNILDFIVTSHDLPKETPQEAKTFAALKKRNWENAIKLALTDAPKSEPSAEWSRLWSWSKSLRAALLANPRGGSAEARTAFALMVGMRRILFLSNLLPTLPLQDLVELRGFVSDAILPLLDNLIVLRWQDATQDKRDKASEELYEQATEELASNELLASLLVRLPGLDPMRYFVILLSHVMDHRENEIMEAYIRSHTERLREIVGAAFDEGEYGTELFFSLSYSHETWPSELLLKHFDAIWRTDDDRWALFHCLEERGDVALFDTLLAEWRPGEIETAKMVYFLAALRGTTRDLPEELVDDASEEDDERDEEEHVLRPISLRCKACQSVYRYEVNRVSLSDDKSGEEEKTRVYIAMPIDCKKCKVRDQYELTVMSSMYLNQILEEDHDMEERHKRVTHNPVAVYGNHILSTWSEGYEISKRRTEESPDDFDYWRRLGNYLRNGQQIEEALGAFQRARALRPDSLDVTLSIATCYLSSGEPNVKDGLPFLAEVIDGFAGSSLVNDEAVEAINDGLYDAAQEAPIGLRAWMHFYERGKRGGEPVISGEAEDLGVLALEGFEDWEGLESFLSSGVVSKLELVYNAPKTPSKFSQMLDRVMQKIEPQQAQPKVGRNEPCPCGSGQKYKKCHGK